MAMVPDLQAIAFHLVTSLWSIRISKYLFKGKCTLILKCANILRAAALEHISIKKHKLKKCLDVNIVF